jgi:tetratricopeptide (TPR) repeat protein
MTSLLLALLLTPQAYTPEIEAVMNRPRTREQRSAPPVATPAPAVAATNLPVPPEVAAPFQACLDAAIESPDRGVAEANAWRMKGGGFYARQCMGFAYARAERWAPAIVAFEQAAEEAERSGAMPQSARLWAQAGNAALAGGDAAKARTDLDAALTRGIPDGLEKGEVHLDRARALVALNDPRGARESLDVALDQAPQDPLGWLLSATLARRSGEMPLAQAHIARAVQRSPDDASVALEEGNIAVLTGHDDVARSAWRRAVKLAPDSPMGKAAADNITRLPPAEENAPAQSR